MIKSTRLRWQRASIVERLTITTVVITLVLTLVGTSSFVWRVHRQQEADLLDRSKEELALYAETLAAPVWSLQAARVGELLHALFPVHFGQLLKSFG